MIGISICRSVSCPSIIHFGSRDDEDVVEVICPNCEKKYYQSHRRRKRVILFLVRSLIVVSALGLLFTLKDSIMELVKPEAFVETSFGLKSAVIVQDSLVVLDFNGSPAKRYLRGKKTITLTSDTLITSIPGKYRIIYETKDSSYFREITIIPSSIPQVILDDNSGDTINDRIKPLKTKTDRPTISNPMSKQDDIADLPKTTSPKAIVPTQLKPKFDCQRLGKNFSDPCTDANPNTYDDKVQEDCSCQGTPKKTYTWYEDEDKDGKGDGNVKLVTDTNSRPEGYTNNKADKCPDRQARNSADGCPTIEIAVPNEVFFGESFTSGIDLNPLIDDEIKWTADHKVKLVGQNTSKVSLTFEEYGPATIVVDVRGNSDGFRESASKKICVQITPAEVQRQIKDYIAPLGMYQAGNYISNEKVNEAGEAISLLVSLADPSIQISNKGRQFGNDLRAFLEAKVQTRESYVNDVKVNNLLYDLNTCKVKKLSLNLIK